MLLDLRVPILPELSPRPQARHYPRGTFAIETGVKGASASGVMLERAILTHFCVASHTRWPMHSHESEQITLVLEGELFFDLGERVVAVRESDAMAILAHVPHAVFTEAACAETVDARSPAIRQLACVACPESQE
jgi:quercetin dioxygenase-like cupin family protein